MASLLEEKQRLDAELRARLSDVWAILHAAFGSPSDLQSAEPDLDAFRQSTDGVEVAVRVRVEDPWAGPRYGTSWIHLSAALLDAGSKEALRESLTRTFPLECAACGLRAKLGSLRCASPAKCWGLLRWRADAPAPHYYVETQASYGYFLRGPRPRGLRFAVDLSSGDLFGVQLTRRGVPDLWRTPALETAKSIFAAIHGEALCDLGGALAGKINTMAQPRCFSFHAPDWNEGLHFPHAVNLPSARGRGLAALG